jgi:predicted short-subunit dehydrogenase-like oxidoreductase (DUF2520 family)
VAQALGRLLYDSGQPVRYVASRDREHACAAARFIGPEVRAVEYAELAVGAPRLLIAVSDSALAPVAASLGAVRGILLHTCGAQGADVLRSPQAPEVACGTLHPLQTIADGAAGSAALEGIAFAVSGDEAAVAWAEQIAAIAHGRVLRIPDQRRPLYHAAAVMAGNYQAALLAAAQTLLAAAEVEPAEALAALGPLARTSLENVLRAGPAAALTGPIQRGDLGTLAVHLEALRGVSPVVERLYRAAGLETLEVSRERGLSAERAAEIEQMLEMELSGK